MTQKLTKAIRLENLAGGLNRGLFIKVVKLIVRLTGTEEHKTGMGSLRDKILRLWEINRKPFVVKYLKCCFLITVNTLAHSKYVSQPGDPIVSVDSNGIPRIIPKDLRRHIVCADHEKDWMLIQAILSIFNLYRIISVPGSLKLQSITDPFNGINQEFDGRVIETGIEMLLGRVPRIKGRWSFVHISSAGPNARVSTMSQWPDLRAGIKQPLSFWKAAGNISKIITNRSILIQYFIGSLVCSIITEPLGLGKSTRKTDGRPIIGKLVEKQEGAGKIRVFAITDWGTQNLMKPLHDNIFKILETIPIDGTFDQTAIFERSCNIAKKNRVAGSFDLSAATDRLPVKLQKQIVALMTSQEVANSWATLLTERDWYHKGTPYRYSVGQPIGAYSSGGILALTHHVLVQISAYRAGGKTRFEDYSVLGDDVVIFDAAVADNYLIVIKDLGLEINLSKSIISPKGGFEFAKRFAHPEIDVSPLGAKSLLLSVVSSKYFSTCVVDAAQKQCLDQEDTISKLTTIAKEDGLIKEIQVEILYIGLFGPGGIFCTKPSLTTGVDRDRRFKRGIPTIVERLKVDILMQDVERDLSQFYIRILDKKWDNPIDHGDIDISYGKDIRTILTGLHPVTWVWENRMDDIRSEMWDFAHGRSMQLAPFADALDTGGGLSIGYQALIQIDNSKYDISFGTSPSQKIMDIAKDLGDKERRNQELFLEITAKGIPRENVY